MPAFSNKTKYCAKHDIIISAYDNACGDWCKKVRSYDLFDNIFKDVKEQLRFLISFFEQREERNRQINEGIRIEYQNKKCKTKQYNRIKIKKS